MSFDLFATLGQSDGVHPENMHDLNAIATVYHFLVATGRKKDKNTGADALRSKWSKKRLAVNGKYPTPGLWQWFDSPEIDLSILPRWSFAISFKFKLARPYLSKDDNIFYVIDNPIRKDKVFKLPMVAPSSWKGNLRHSFWQLQARYDGKDYHDDRIKRMFGETRDDDLGQTGRLRFYPTFFGQMGLEVINPHDRIRRVGKNPILFESVPEGTQGHFTLLYVPFDRIGKDEAETRRQVAEDLVLLAQGLQAMFTLYGFGAKTSSGFGLAAEKLPQKGFLAIHAQVEMQTHSETSVKPDPLHKLNKDIESFKQRFGLDIFPRWDNAQLKASGWGKKRQSEYKRLRNRHPDWDVSTGTWKESQPAPEPESTVEPPRVSENRFNSFSKLCDLAEHMANQLKKGGEA